MSPQPFACSLKLLKRVGVEGRSEKKGRRRISQKRENDAPEENEARDNASTHTNTESRRRTHGQTTCQPTTQHWVFRPPEFSCLPVLGSPYRMASTAHQTRAQERNSLSCRASCLPARPLASALRRLELPVRSPLYRKLSPAPDTFLPHSSVRECLTGGFLHAVPHESFAPLQAEQHAAPRD